MSNAHHHKKTGSNGFLRDIGIIAISVLVAVILVKSGILLHVINSVNGFGFLSSFIAGVFFTSVFTTAPAIAALGEISITHSLFMTAFFGALGAMLGDLVIFRFMRDTFSEHISHMVQMRGMSRRLKHLFKLRFFHWFTLLLGGLIIASPFPDELGLSLLGFSHMRTSRFLPMSFTFNFVGILLVGLAARALAQ
ncbi:hypothetical protein COU18_00600 [Candidatus Kaiserbacteria bacterium CG10_big_fil_rev_8_21_14_0_10_51_14]|uniref:Uncharacterized protein n=1 Tax=Candidatus Kaiserbacteria bacterium CG10_big_fil_rev_8_21_14_0_10_51_14 TaxID=1974610 RepID=A0A2H0UBY4_9BACT|nr:MAG: hypothetical protein COU18_00600 [Candidatus Kaiserbacteria bacterium CG10_big_fil_rev_8_21_14_0_10_51_14]